ncbi:hypothetical protein cyc_05703 [Cyclospora cayetanensis]|uniref:Uncharacterized protein n=1 Tax=Cyclospora cayetanensis TaxID=88456 RepID=A0A1D3CYX9_9EIME|nr:hypothetical protein cyc_05703 [Cyclospora cayetanensis]
MGNFCGSGPKTAGIEADICRLFSDEYREEGLKIQRQIADQRPARLTDQDWVEVMDRGPSQWRLQLPPNLQKECTEASEESSAIPARARRRWSSVMGVRPPVVQMVDGLPLNLRGPSSQIEDRGLGTSERPTRAPLGDAKLCEIEVLQAGCCTVRFDTMRQLVDQLNEKGLLQKHARLSPALPLAEKKQPEASCQAVLIEASPIVLQSTLPLPQQSEVYCEVELLSFVPFKSYVSIGVATAPYPQNHLPGLLPGSCALLSTGQVCVGSQHSAADGQVLMIGENSFLFKWNTRMGGKGELEINFGGKAFNLTGEITKVSKGAVQSTAPIAARAFGYRLAKFHVMLDELKLFYACFNPPMVPKAKGMVVLNISRQKEFNAELKEAHGKDLTDVRQQARDINKRKLVNFFRQHDIQRLSQVDRIFEDFDGDVMLQSLTLRVVGQGSQLEAAGNRKSANALGKRHLLLCGVEAMLVDYFKLMKRRQDSLKLEAVADQALFKPAMVDTFLRERYKSGINILLKNRLRQVYALYSPESMKEIDYVAEKYPLFDDAYMLATKLRVRYGVDLESFSPTVCDGEEGQPIRSSAAGGLAPGGSHLGALFAQEGPAESLENEQALRESSSLNASKGRHERGPIAASHSSLLPKKEQRESNIFSKLTLSISEPFESLSSRNKRPQPRTNKRMSSFRSRSRLSTQEEDSLGHLSGEARGSTAAEDPRRTCPENHREAVLERVFKEAGDGRGREFSKAAAPSAAC